MVVMRTIVIMILAMVITIITSFMVYVSFMFWHVFARSSRCWFLQDLLCRRNCDVVEVSADISAMRHGPHLLRVLPLQ